MYLPENLIHLNTRDRVMKIEIQGLSDRINEKVGSLSPASSDRCNFKVPNALRKVNESAYEPEMIAIGPYHRGKDHLKAMEEHKIRHLEMFLRRSNEASVSGLVEAMWMLEERARNCYSEPVILTKHEFVEMMVFDGCFMVELFCSLIPTPFGGPLSLADLENVRLMPDLLLVENQLPFFVVTELFNMISSDLDHKDLMIKIIISVIKLAGLPGHGYTPPREYNLEEIKQIKHLLGLLHDNWQPLPPRMQSYLSMRKKQVEISFPRSAINLREAGIRFKKVEEQNLFDISLKNGVIGIPTMRIGDQTETLMRNLIAYEQLNPIGTSPHVTEYMSFMESIIYSGKDAELLSSKGIIENLLGDDETVATLFNKIGVNVLCDRALYADIQNSLDMHCKKTWNLWKASLRHNYFQKPLSLGGSILLVLTFAQTVYSVLSYYKTN